MGENMKSNKWFNRFDDPHNDMPAWVEHIPRRGSINGQEELAKRERIRQKLNLVEDARNLGRELLEVWEFED